MPVHVCNCVCVFSGSKAFPAHHLTTLPAPRGLPARPRVAGTTYLCWEELPHLLSQNFQEGLDSEISPAVWGPLADLLPVTCPPWHQPPCQSPSPRAQILHIRLSFLHHRESPLEPLPVVCTREGVLGHSADGTVTAEVRRRFGRAAAQLPSPAMLFT